MRRSRFDRAIGFLIVILAANLRLDAQEKASPRLRPSGIDGAVLILGDKVLGWTPSV